MSYDNFFIGFIGLFVKVGVDDFRLKMGLKEPEIDFLELN